MAETLVKPLALFRNLADSADIFQAVPEACEAVPPYTRPLSASALKLFGECRRKWFYRYLCNVIEDPGSSAGTYGTALHEALEYLHHRFPKPHEVAEAEMLQALKRLIDECFERHSSGFTSRLEAEMQRRRAQRTAVQYVAWLMKRAHLEPFTVVGNETSAPLTIDGYRFTGYIDRLDQSERDGGITVIDYKTGSIAENAAEYRDDIIALREFQLPFYYWARTEQGDRITRLALIPLKEPHLEVLPVELEIVPGFSSTSGRGKRGTIGIEELKRARAHMAESAAQLTEATLSDFAATSNREACTYCAYTAACRNRPNLAESPFGRS